MKHNRLHQTWAAGKPAVNGWASIPNAFSAEIMSMQDFDSVTIDLQHGLNDYASALSMLQAMSADYVRTARAKGLREHVVVIRHALRNALTPVITLGALEFGTLLSGAVLTEQVFSIPGFGKLIVDAVFNRDYAVVQGVVLVTAFVYMVLNLLADVLYVLANPRLGG